MRASSHIMQLDFTAAAMSGRSPLRKYFPESYGVAHISWLFHTTVGIENCDQSGIVVPNIFTILLFAGFNNRRVNLH